MRWWRRHLVELAILIATLGLALWATPAFGAFPYTRSGGDPNNFTDLYLTDQVPGDLCGDGNQFKFAASPDPDNSLTNADPVELGGVRGAHLVDGKPSQATSCDANGDRVFNIEDYACDSRVAAVLNQDTRRVGPPGVLTPQDVIIAFSDGSDGDG